MSRPRPVAHIAPWIWCSTTWRPATASSKCASPRRAPTARLLGAPLRGAAETSYEFSENVRGDDRTRNPDPAAEPRAEQEGRESVRFPPEGPPSHRHAGKVSIRPLRWRTSGGFRPGSTSAHACASMPKVCGERLWFRRSVLRRVPAAGVAPTLAADGRTLSRRPLSPGFLAPPFAGSLPRSLKRASGHRASPPAVVLVDPAAPSGAPRLWTGEGEGHRTGGRAQCKQTNNSRRSGT